MIPPVTGREALLIEALGEMAVVLDRVEALIPALEACQRGLIEANGQLAAQLGTIEVRLAGFAEHARAHAIQHIALHTDRATRRSIDLHVKAMEEAARTLFAKELAPALQGLVQPLLRLRELVQQSARPWDGWLTHAATAAASFMATWLLGSGVWRS